MLTPNGQVKILDFGLARFVSETTALLPATRGLPAEDGSATLTLQGAEPAAREGSATAGPLVVGTPDYMAPEGVQDPLGADRRADIYGLGCTLYRFLAGRVPFPGGTVGEKMSRHQSATPTPLGELRPEVPRRLVEVVSRMMEKDPARRYQSAAEVASVLAPFTAPGLGQVLVVEDEPVTRQALVLVLEAEGCTVAQAGNGQEALELLRGGLRPGVILLDLAMPVMDGWQFLRERERDPALAVIPVVVVSAVSSGQARAAALGAVAFLHKPVDPGALAGEVRRCTQEGQR
jgi:CheY-like chemotaxis protein